ncbi:MAG TPA: hypothetical protein VHW60_16435 [Caulobacteraceae bacterium]|jgi:hypothetical protein|nr:hypothetical protein [Caulobacteraceae bacterium]
MRAAGIVILLIGAACLLLNVAVIVYFMAVTGGWSLSGLARQPVVDFLALTCIVAGALIIRQSRASPSAPLQ